jgi:hypothetical protein
MSENKANPEKFNSVKFDEIIKKIQARAKENSAKKDEKAAETSVKIFLPGMNEVMRAMPNYLARGSIFAPVARGRKKMHNDTVFWETDFTILTGFGLQLTEDLADIWMHAIYLASQIPLGESVTINRAEFLRAIGRNDDLRSYQWLYAGVTSLSKFTISIIAKKSNGVVKYSIGKNESSRVMQMLGGFDYDEKTGQYSLVVDPRWKLMFGNREYALVDWEKRLQISQGLDLAKSIQRLVATSDDKIQRFSLEYLKGRAQSEGRMRDFKESLLKAMQELERLNIISHSKIELSTKGVEQATWNKI